MDYLRDPKTFWISGHFGQGKPYTCGFFFGSVLSLTSFVSKVLVSAPPLSVTITRLLTSLSESSIVVSIVNMISEGRSYAKANFKSKRNIHLDTFKVLIQDLVCTGVDLIVCLARDSWCPDWGQSCQPWSPWWHRPDTDMSPLSPTQINCAV